MKSNSTIPLIVLILLTLLLLSNTEKPDDRFQVGDVMYSVLEPIPFMEDHPGWVPMQGQSLQGTRLGSSGYGFERLPDARGLFIRVQDDSAHIDPDGKRAIIHVQSDALQDHTHAMRTAMIEDDKGYRMVATFSGNAENDPPNGYSDEVRSNLHEWQKRKGMKMNDVKINSIETRPVNIALYLYVKVN